MYDEVRGRPWTVFTDAISGSAVSLKIPEALNVGPAGIAGTSYARRAALIVTGIYVSAVTTGASTIAFSSIDDSYTPGSTLTFKMCQLNIGASGTWTFSYPHLYWHLTRAQHISTPSNGAFIQVAYGSNIGSCSVTVQGIETFDGWGANSFSPS